MEKLHDCLLTLGAEFVYSSITDIPERKVRLRDSEVFYKFKDLIEELKSYEIDEIDNFITKLLELEFTEYDDKDYCDHIHFRDTEAFKPIEKEFYRLLDEY